MSEILDLISKWKEGSTVTAGSVVSQIESIEFDRVQNELKSKNPELPKQPQYRYEKVTESIFDLKDEFERGELFYSTSMDNFALVRSEHCFSEMFSAGNVYRRIELTPEELHDKEVSDLHKDFIRLVKQSHKAEQLNIKDIEILGITARHAIKKLKG